MTTAGRRGDGRGKPPAHFYALIMAGGRGTRFWPRSRKARAKQVLAVLSEQSLIQETYDRLRPLVPPERFLIITNSHLRDEIVRQLPEVPPGQIIAEPAQRNTAPCIGLAARILLEQNPDAVMGVFPADHVITRPAAFRQVLRRAHRAAAKGHIVVLGIQPRWPETGYGYIEFPKAAKEKTGAQLASVPVVRFREKPDTATARRFLRGGNFYWNSGMFLWKASVIDAALREFLPRTAAALAKIHGFPAGADFERSLAKWYPKTENISIDYAVLEKARDIVGFRCAGLGWNDVGSWNAVHGLLPRDQHGNVARGEAVFHKARGSYVDAPGKLVALVGLDDIIVVDTPDALLVIHREMAQEVGEVVRILEKQRRHDLL